MLQLDVESELLRGLFWRPAAYPKVAALLLKRIQDAVPQYLRVRCKKTIVWCLKCTKIAFRRILFQLSPLMGLSLGRD